MDVVTTDVNQYLEAARMVGAGCATIGVIGAGVGIVLFSVIFY